MKWKTMNKRIIGILAGLAIYVVFLVHPFGLVLPNIIYINVTESLPVGVYLAIPSVAMRNGDTVAFQQRPDVMETIYKNGWMRDGASPTFIKRAAFHGSYDVDPEDLAFRVNGVFIGSAMRDDGKGHTLYPQIGTHDIAAGEFLPYTLAPRSYDGRYYGTVKTEQIETRVIPFLTK
ncbi:MAG: S26 family signal peptidase [Selenomonas artemidis]|jgi:hypothetical protein